MLKYEKSLYPSEAEEYKKDGKSVSLLSRKNG
jgi:hypothetical protein